EMTAWMARIDKGKPLDFVAEMIRHVGSGAPLMQRAGMLARAFAAMPALMEGAAGHCEIGRRVAARLELGRGMHEALGQTYERWDGRGMPGKLRGETIHPAVRVVTLAQDAGLYFELGGVTAAVEMARSRAGGA